MNCYLWLLIWTVTPIITLLCHLDHISQEDLNMVPILPAAIATTAFLRFVAPNLPVPQWNSYNQELSDLLKPLHHNLSTGEISSDEAGDCFNLIVSDFLSSKPGFLPDPKPEHNYTRRENKTLKEAKILKNKLRKKAFSKWGTNQDKATFYDALHTYDYLKKQHMDNTQNHNAKYEEKKYRSDFWSFSKKLVKGTLYEEPKFPTFSKAEADTFFQNTYNVSVELNHNAISWFPYIPVENNQHPFNREPIRPRDIRSVLKNKTSNSAPGPDGITYGVLKKLPTTHHFLATLYNKVTESGLPPPSWCDSRITLIHKKGETNIPSNFRMIALASCVGKIYHQIIADRFDDYLVKNQLINTTFQKAFLKGKNGCVEHNQVIHELIRHAKTNNRTLHITWFDLQDAFGSVPHDLIKLTLSRNGIPVEYQNYINTLYSNLHGSAVTKSWTSDKFPFKKGIFQGDPLSPIIFIMCFNPIIQALESNQHLGYKLNDRPYITAPFADDFCLLTGNKRTHQRLINSINTHTSSMGLKLKPVKCRSMSIVSGKPTNIPFKIAENDVPTLFEKEHTFLGSLITSHNKDSDIFEYIKDKLESGLTNIDNSLIRNEYKLRVYTDYFLPSMRFHLTVNDMTKTHLDNLDSLVRRYIKKWAGLPRPGTVSFLHMPQGLNIKTVSDLYMECHALAHISSRIKADEAVNHCLDSRIQRESQWTHKISHATQCEQLFTDLQNDSDISNITLTNHSAKTQIKKTLQQTTSDYWYQHVKSLSVQGRFLELLVLEEGATHWKSIIYNLPHNVYKFLINAVSDSLNHNSNLVRWGKRSNDRCPACGNKETLQHVLNICSVYLDQGRFTWRHNNILNYIWMSIKEGLNSKGVRNTVNADIDNRRTGYTTVPTQCTVTNMIPDICVLLPDENKLYIIELSVPFEPNIKKMHDYKVNKYTALVNDIESNQYHVYLLALEIGSRGYISCDNDKTLKLIHKSLSVQTTYKTFKQNICKLAIISSFVIFHAKTQPHWDSLPLLQVTNSM